MRLTCDTEDLPLKRATAPFTHCIYLNVRLLLFHLSFRGKWVYAPTSGTPHLARFITSTVSSFRCPVTLEDSTWVTCLLKLPQKVETQNHNFLLWGFPPPLLEIVCEFKREHKTMDNLFTGSSPVQLYTEMWSTLNTPLSPYPDPGSELWSTLKQPVSSCCLSNEYSQIWLPGVWRIAAFPWAYSGNLQPPSVILGDRREAHRTVGGISVEQRHNGMTTWQLDQVVRCVTPDSGT